MVEESDDTGSFPFFTVRSAKSVMLWQFGGTRFFPGRFLVLTSLFAIIIYYYLVSGGFGVGQLFERPPRGGERQRLLRLLVS